MPGRRACICCKCDISLRASAAADLASTPTCSNGVGDTGWEEKAFRQEENKGIDIGPILLSPEGLKGLQRENELTNLEVKALLESGLPPSQYTFMLMEWVGLYAMEGFRDGVLVGGSGVEQVLFKK